MNTHESFVSLEIARLLKEAGFDWKVNTCRYNSSPDKVSSNGTLTSNFNWYAFQHIAISAPTLEVAQRWLREVKKAHIEASPENDEYTEWLVCVYDYNHTAYSGYKTYEEALEAGIKKALEIILEKVRS